MTHRSLETLGRPSIRLDRTGIASGTRLGRALPGRLVVGLGVVGLLIAWGGLYVLFVGWRSGVEARIAFGKDEVAPEVRGLADLEPKSIGKTPWQTAVADTEAMLEEVVGTGRIDRPGLESLRSDLRRRVADARLDPDAAPLILAGIWDDMARLKRLRDDTQRPELLPESGTDRPIAPQPSEPDR